MMLQYCLSLLFVFLAVSQCSSESICSVYKNLDECRENGNCVWEMTQKNCFESVCSDYEKRKECNDDVNCIWEIAQKNCKKMDYLSLNMIYKNTNMGIFVDAAGRCFDTDFQKMLTIKVQPPSTVPTCFSEFYEEALLPICGHEYFKLVQYCHMAQFYENRLVFSTKQRKYIDILEATDRLLILLDGCLFCSSQNNYFSKHKPEILLDLTMEDEAFRNNRGIEYFILNRFKVFDISSNGDFFVVLQLIIGSEYDIGYGVTDEQPVNVSMQIRHRCNRDMLLQYKVITIRLEKPSAYKSRVWTSEKTIIGLDQGDAHIKEVDFNELPGKQDQ